MSIKYTEDHEWVSIDGDIGTVGITRHAADQIGEAVYAEPPEVGTTVSMGDDMGVIENNKAASDIFAPVSGEVVERNDRWDDPEALDELIADPAGAGWFCKIKLSDAGELDKLMDEAAYTAFVSNG